MRWIKPFATLALLTLLPSVAFSLAPAQPGIKVIVDPESLEIQAGGSGTLTVTVKSQEGFEGLAELGVIDTPEGITATWSENPIEVPPFSEIATTLTITVASGTPAGELEIKISGKAPGSIAPLTPVIITVTESDGGEEPPANGGEEPPANGGEEPPAGEVRTITLSTTVTTATTVTETIIITTRTSDIATKTSATPEQAYEAIYPAVTILAVIALLAVAVLALRGR